MAVYLISYDLNKAGKDYSGLIEEIKKIDPNTYHVLKSQWLVMSPKNAIGLNSILDKFIDEDDDLLIIEVTRNYSGYIRNHELVHAWLDSRL